jgi:pimeloyl-ACP methyl ester carboxylesterase
MTFSVDGHAIDYDLRGAGRLVVLVHGLTVDHRVMVAACEPAFDEQRGFRRLYLDLPGHGASRGNAERASADDLVTAIAELVRAVVEPSHTSPLLVGYSYGGYLAQGLLRALAPLGGLFLACPIVEPDFAKRTQPPRRVARRDPELPFSDDVREREAFTEVAVQQTEGLLAEFQRLVHPANVAADQNFVAAVRSRYLLSRPYLQALKDLDGPVDIVCGRDDHWAGWEDAGRLVRLCRRPSFTVLPDCGHLLPLEQPERFRSLFVDWLRRASAAT